MSTSKEEGPHPKTNILFTLIQKQKYSTKSHISIQLLPTTLLSFLLFALRQISPPQVCNLLFILSLPSLTETAVLNVTNHLEVTNHLQSQQTLVCPHSLEKMCPGEYKAGHSN